ncbi:transporter substrate-binding domain-containing protein [Pelagibacterium halotolerans]|uniref:transporter substrate-binding domain-containing protein n=1 Tax=Pelagibacterium halotolerans TaxID=531813 RepID=UPI00031FAED0|nr:transporter substrate-binding domain-containing protein [Pelagibacterium halotolerans]QJR19618.1 transporter substrate-binding domain-containing protein [Pelagibacterium halotolerans]
MLRAALLAAFIFIGATGCAGAQNLPVHVDPGARDDMIDPVAVPALRFLTTPDFPPFNYTDAAGRLTGFNIDLADAICARLEARCTIQSWPWDRVQDALADNQGDALIAGLDIGGSAGERFDFSRIYLQLPARFVTQRPVFPDFDPQAITGTVAVREGSAHADLAERTLGRAQMAFYPSEFEALNAIASGEADFFFGDAARASFWLNENPDCCAFAGEAYFRPDLFGAGLAVAVPIGLDNVRVAINWALTRLQREGRIDEIYLRWFPVSFY